MLQCITDTESEGLIQWKKTPYYKEMLVDIALWHVVLNNCSCKWCHFLWRALVIHMLTPSLSYLL